MNQQDLIIHLTTSPDFEECKYCPHFKLQEGKPVCTFNSESSIEECHRAIKEFDM